MLDMHLLAVAREFCHVTKAWRLPFDDVNTVANVATYDLESSESQSEPVMVHKLTVNGIILWDDKSSENRKALSLVDRPKYQRDDPPFELSIDLKQITLLGVEVPTTSQVKGLKIEGSMKPKHNATQLPDFFASTHLETIRVGVLSRLMFMKKPWGDVGQANFYTAQYNKNVALAAYNGQVGNTNRPLRVKKWG